MALPYQPVAVDNRSRQLLAPSSSSSPFCALSKSAFATNVAVARGAGGAAVDDDGDGDGDDDSASSSPDSGFIVVN